MIDETTAAVGAISAALGALVTKIFGSPKDRQTHERRLKQIEAEQATMSSLSDRCAALEATSQRLLDRLDILQDHNTTLIDRISTLEAERAELQHRIDQLEQSSRADKRLIRDLQERLTQTQTELDDARKELQNLTEFKKRQARKNHKRGEKTMWNEILTIAALSMSVVLDEEVRGGTGEEKKQRATAEIMAIIQSPEGISVKNKIVLRLLPWLISSAINFAVSQANKSGLFSK